MTRPLPPHLEGMTQARWDCLSPAERERLRDTSDMNPQLRPFIGRKVRVEPKRPHGASTFRVGCTTGWRPALLAMRAGARGSSDLIGAGETFTRIVSLS